MIEGFLASDIPQTIGHSYDDLLRLSEQKIKQPSQSKMHPQSPKCITTQPSFAINSLMPQIPNKSPFIGIDDDENADQKSVDNYISTLQPTITTNEQFENIHRNDEQRPDEMLILMNSNIYHDEQPNWSYYSTKPDLFPSTLPLDLPIAQPDDEQHLSLKQTFLSHFHRRRKMPLANHSSSLNAIDLIRSLESSHQCIDQTFVWKKISKRGTFRVRKSRVMVSFDDIQSRSNTTSPSSPEVRRNNLDHSILLLLQSLHTTIRQSEESQSSEIRQICTISQVNLF